MSRGRRGRCSAELARPPGRRGSVGLGPGPRRQQQPRRGRGVTGSGLGSGCAAPRAQVDDLAGLERAPWGVGGQQGPGRAGPAGAGGESRVRKWRRGASLRWLGRPRRRPGGERWEPGRIGGHSSGAAEASRRRPRGAHEWPPGTCAPARA